MKKLKVIQKWGVDGNLAVIYLIGGNGYEKRLYFYNIKKDPDFQVGTEISTEEFLKTKVYKDVKYSDRRIPNDAYMML